MNGVEIAAMIAAVAFAALIIFAMVTLRPILKNLSTTIEQSHQSLNIITKDVNDLSREVEGLLNKTNVLVDDLNGKLEKTDPLFAAIGDLGESVADVNDSTRKLTEKVVETSKESTEKVSRFIKIGKSMVKGKKNKV